MAENDNDQSQERSEPADKEPQYPSGPQSLAEGMDEAYRAKVEEQKSMFDKLVRLSRRRMPTLELIHEKFARTVRLTLFNMIRSPVEVWVHRYGVLVY